MENKLLKKKLNSNEKYQSVLKLIQEKNYNKIYELYGSIIYTIATPTKIRKKDISQLLKDGRFQDIYQKHGPKVLNSKISKIRQIDTYNETGSIPKSIFQRIKAALFYKATPIALASAVSIPTLGIAYDTERKIYIAQNGIKYASDLEQYNSKLNSYTNEIKKMNLSDTQIIMKLMYDMWNNIQGYGSPKKDVLGYLRLDMVDDGIGVCRNMADDMVAKLNAINPEYMARNLCVYMDSSKNFNIANIHRNLAETNDTVSQNNYEPPEIASKIIGNHAVVMMDIPGEETTLIVDPTNPSIGIVRDGKIQMFSTDDGNGLSFVPIGQVMLEGVDSTANVLINKYLSPLESKLTDEELLEKYGLSAQNAALDEIKKLNSKPSSFREGLSIDVTNKIPIQPIFTKEKEELQK